MMSNFENYFQDRTLKSITFVLAVDFAEYEKTKIDITSPFHQNFGFEDLFKIQREHNNNNNQTKTTKISKSTFLYQFRFPSSSSSSSSSSQGFSAFSSCRRCDRETFLNLISNSTTSDIIFYTGSSSSCSKLISYHDNSNDNSNNSCDNTEEQKEEDEKIRNKKVFPETIEEFVSTFSDIAMFVGHEEEKHNNSDNKNNFVTGKEICDTLRSNPTASTGGSCAIFLDCNFSILAALHQYHNTLPDDGNFCYNQLLKKTKQQNSNSSSSSSIATINACAAESFRNCMTTLLCCSARNSNLFSETRKNVDKIFLEERNLFFSKNNNNEKSSSSLFRQASFDFIANLNLERNQFPLLLVPLRMFEETKSSTTTLDLFQVLFQRFCYNIPNFQRFLLKPATTKKSSSLMRNETNKNNNNTTNNNNTNNNLCLVSIDPNNKIHQQVIFDILTSKEFEKNICPMPQIQTLEDAKEYIINRPQKMFMSEGIGSFLIAVKNVCENCGRKNVEKQNNLCSSASASAQEKQVTLWKAEFSPNSLEIFHREKIFSEKNNDNEKENVLTFVGIAGLICRPQFSGDLDLGFALLPQFFGKGYASAASILVLQWAQRVLMLNKVRAVTKTTNIASQKLLHNLGFVRDADVVVDWFDESNYTYTLEL